MPRGRPKNKVEEPAGLVSSDGFTDEEVGGSDVRKEKEAEKKTKEVKRCGPPHLPQCQCQDVLSPGQAYFEDGETGTIRIGEDNKGEIWFRNANGGKGGWINKKR